MKDHLKNLERKKLIIEYTFTKTDLELKKSIIEESHAEFMKKIYEEVGQDTKEHGEISKIKNEKKQFPDYIRKKAKSLYREISKKTHPDKDPSGVYSDVFSAAAIAYEECNILDLYTICYQLNILYEIDESEIDDIKIRILDNKEMVNKIENSFIYLWSINENEKIREIMINNFLRETRGKI